jgi:hypothetical protein
MCEKICCHKIKLTIANEISSFIELLKGASSQLHCTHFHFPIMIFIVSLCLPFPVHSLVEPSHFISGFNSSTSLQLQQCSTMCNERRHMKYVYYPPSI